MSAVVTAPSMLAPKPPAGSGGLRAHFATTPGRLHLALLLLSLAPLLLWLAAAGSVERTQQAIKTIQSDAAPSIIAADTAHADLADMDANAANGFLGSGAEVHERQAYEAKRQDADDQLVTAAQNITYGDAERVPIQTMDTRLQEYTGLVEAARALRTAGKDGTPLLLTASALMHGTILPAAEALRRVNDDHLQAAYTQIQADNRGALAGFLLTGVLSLLFLLVIQVALSRHTHRTLNLPLALATLVLLLFVGRLSAVLIAERADLKLAKQDSFDSVDALWGAKATAYEANGYESLYLLAQSNSDPQREYEQDFYAQSKKLADAPVTAQTVTGASQAISPTPAGQVSTANPNAVTFHGDLADELNNVTFPGERESALAMLAGYGSYMDIDGQIRALERQGKHQAAVNLCIGYRPGQSDAAFEKFDDALTQTLNVNLDYFGKACGQAQADLRGFIVLDPLMAVLLVALSWFGILPRLQEYRA